MQINKLMKLSKKVAVVATAAMTLAMPLTAYAAPANFNAAYYAAQNPDVVKVYGSSYEALAKHYDTFGMLEGRDAFAGDTKAAFIRLANAHYAAGSGLAKVFDAKWYAKMNPDAVKVFGNDPRKLYEHFIIYGLAEGRVPSENFDAQEFFSENAALAVVVAKAFADVPTASTNSFVQVAQQVSNTLNVVNANPVVNVTTETTNNTVNNTVNNSSDKEETPAQTSQSVNKLEAVKQMTAQATKSKDILTASASSMNSKASEAKTKMAAIQREIAALNGEMTQEQREEFIDRITEVIGLAYSAQEEAIVLNNQVQVVAKNTEASIRYAAEYLNELTTTKTNLTNKKDSLEAQKAVAEESFAAGVTNFEGASAALTTAQRALNNANSAYANAVALVETLTNQKAEQIEIVAQAQTAAQEAEQAVRDAATAISQTTEVQTILTERQIYQNEYDNMTDEVKASAGAVVLQKIEELTVQANQIANDLTTDLRNDLVDKGNAYNREATKLTGITNQLASAEEAVTTTSANAAAAAENLEQAKTDYLADLDTQIANTTDAINQVQETIDEVNVCGQEMYDDVQAIYGDEVFGATVEVIGTGTDANPGSSSETFQAAEEAREEVNNATIVLPATPDEESSENTSENNSSNQD